MFAPLFLPGCKLHSSDEQFAAGGKEIQVLAAEIVCSVERCHGHYDQEARICQERWFSSGRGVNSCHLLDESGW